MVGDNVIEAVHFIPPVVSAVISKDDVFKNVSVPLNIEALNELIPIPVWIILPPI